MGTKLIEMNPAAISKNVNASTPVIHAIRFSKTLIQHLDSASKLAAAGNQSALILTAFLIVRQVYPNLEKPARDDAIELIRAWSANGSSVIRYASSAWAPFKRAIIAGNEGKLVKHGIGWMINRHKAGTGKHGFVKATEC